MEDGAVEMTGYGKRGKPKAGFPSFPTALGNRQRRDFHIPTARTTGIPPYKKGKHKNEEPWKSGNPKTGFPLFHGTNTLKKKTRKEGLA